MGKLFTLLILLTLFLTGCKPTLTPKPTVTPTLEPTATFAPTYTPLPTARPPLTETPKPTDTPAPQPTATPTPKAVLITEINLNLEREPAAIDPALAISSAEVSTDELLFLGLTDLDDETSEARPELATEWEVSEDGLTWTFHLRRDAYWVRYNPETGGAEKLRPVTAQDVEYGVKRSLDPTTGSEYRHEYFYVIKGAEPLNTAEPKEVTDELLDAVAVKAINDRTIQFTLEHPAGYFPTLAGRWLVRPQPRELIERYGEEWTEPEKIWTNGPYVLSSWGHGSRMVLEKNPFYYDAEEVSIQRVNFYTEDRFEALAMYLRGELDSVEVPTEEFERVRDDPILSEELHIVPRPCTYYYGFTNNKPPFDDHLVRKAFSASIDRQRLIDEVIKGPQLPANSFAPPGIFGNVAGHPEVGIRHDPEQAKRWLAEAGYPGGQGFPQVILMHSTSGDHRRIAEAITAMWREVLDVDVKVISHKWELYLKTIDPETPSEKTPHIWCLGWCSGGIPDQHNWLYDNFHAREGANRVRRGCKDSTCIEVELARFDKLVEEAAVEHDPAKRAALYKEAEYELNNVETAIAPIYYYARAILTKPWVERTYSSLGIEHIDRWKVTAPPKMAKLPTFTPLPPSPTPTPTPAPSPTPCPTPTPLPTLIPSTLLPLPTKEGIDAYRATMRPGNEGDTEVIRGLPHYDLALQMDIEKEVLRGRERLTYINREDEALEEIVLRLYPNLPQPPECDGQDGMRVGRVSVNGQQVDFTYEALNTAMIIPLPQPLPVGESVAIEMDFAVKLVTGTEGVWNLASFYPMLAVHDESEWRRDVKPCLYGDAVYSESVSYAIDLTVPKSLVVAASGTEVARVDNPDETITRSYRGGPLRDFALSMSEDFQVSTEVVDGIAVNTYYLPGDEEGGKAILRYAADAVGVYNEKFGLYPYANLDVVVIPVPTEGVAAGIEYPGLVFIFHGKGSDPEFTTAHEVAHQWWFGVVGNDILQEPWLDEALANYSAVLYFEAVHGQEAARKVFEGEKVKARYRRAIESGQEDGPVGQSVWDFGEAGPYFPIVYGKGALFLNALRREIGDEVFFAFLQEYYRRYKYKVATGEGFLEVAEEVAGRELDELYDAWVGK